MSESVLPRLGACELCTKVQLTRSCSGCQRNGPCYFVPGLPRQPVEDVLKGLERVADIRFDYHIRLEGSDVVISIDGPEFFIPMDYDVAAWLSRQRTAAANQAAALALGYRVRRLDYTCTRVADSLGLYSAEPVIYSSELYRGYQQLCASPSGDRGDRKGAPIEVKVEPPKVVPRPPSARTGIRAGSLVHQRPPPPAADAPAPVTRPGSTLAPRCSGTKADGKPCNNSTRSACGRCHLHVVRA